MLMFYILWIYCDILRNMKDVIILAASPRKNGNTNWLVSEFTDELDVMGRSYEILDLYNLDMKGCIACRSCQRDWTRPACALGDEDVFDAILDAKAIVLATPVYSWYCTAPAKALLDRCVYAMNKYYGDAGRGPSLWEGKHFALIATCGYPPEKGADLLEEGLKRYCKHSQLEYAGSYTARHEGYTIDFPSEDKKSGIRAFARRITEG